MRKTDTQKITDASSAANGRVGSGDSSALPADVAKMLADCPTVAEMEKRGDIRRLEIAVRRMDRSILRRVMCRLSLCAGHVDHETDANGVQWIGLRCATCGQLNAPIKSAYQSLPNNIIS